MERDDWSLLKRYYSGTCGPEEITHVQAALEPVIGQQSFGALLRELDFEASLPTVPNTAEAYHRFQQRLAEHTPKQEISSARDGFLQRYGLRLAIASAVVVILAVLGVRLGRSGLPVQTYVYQTVSGQRSTVRLPDGSTMMLGPSTTVASTAQGVNVTGEAYFTINPRATRLFVVRTANAQVQVLGTRFSVRQYPGEVRSRIVVEEGRVALSPIRMSRTDHSHAVATARTLAWVSDSSVMVSSGIATRELTSWTEGTLVFKEVPLRDVMSDLSRAYGAVIRITDSTLANQVVGAVVSVSDDPLSRVLGNLCNVLDAHYIRAGSTYMLSPGRASTRAVPVAPPRHTSPQQEQQYGR